MMLVFQEELHFPLLIVFFLLEPLDTTSVVLLSAEEAWFFLPRFMVVAGQLQSWWFLEQATKVHDLGQMIKGQIGRLL